MHNAVPLIVLVCMYCTANAMRDAISWPLPVWWFRLLLCCLAAAVAVVVHSLCMHNAVPLIASVCVYCTANAKMDVILWPLPVWWFKLLLCCLAAAVTAVVVHSLCMHNTVPLIVSVCVCCTPNAMRDAI